MEDYCPEQEMERAPDLMPARVAVPGDQRARRLRGGLLWSVFLGSRQIRRRLPVSDSRVKSQVDGQQAIDAGQPENAVPSQ
jgi:hypothetical protein